MTSFMPLQNPRLRSMVGAGGYYPGGLTPTIGDYSEYPEGGAGDYPEMDSDSGYTQDVGPDPSMQPGMPVPPPIAPSPMGVHRPQRPSRLRGVIGDIAAGAINGAAIQNVAGGGGTDFARAMQAGMTGKTQRDIQAWEMARQQQQDDEMRRRREAQDAHDQSMADWYTRRQAGPGAEVKQARTAFDANGNLVNMETGEVIRKGEPKPTAPMVDVNVDRDNNLSDYAPGFSMGGVQYPGWSHSVKMTNDEVTRRKNADTMQANAERPRGSMVIGYDAQGNQVVTQATPGTGGSPSVGAPVRTGGVKVPARIGAPRIPTRATPTVEIKNLAKQLVSEVNAPGATFEQRRDRAKEMLVQGVWGEHPAVANNKDALVAQIAALTEREFTGATGKSNGLAWNAPAATAQTGQSHMALSAPAPRRTLPKLNEVRNGYMYLGGDPADKNNWLVVKK